MATTTTPPAVCPECGQPYLSRVPKRLDDRINLSRCYRHRTKGHVYIHKI